MAKKENGRELLRQDNDALRKQFIACRNLLDAERKENEELISLNLWSARRLPKVHKEFAYNELEKITNLKHERI